ncbi:MAG: flagellar hook basal-body protein [Proteobacteria bacterium]|nr:flagellar hook basal-body protein [Pseudomonadota bacterium]
MSFYTSLNGLKNAQTELGVISNNLANAETAGFKRSTVNFSDLVAGSAYTNLKLVNGIGSTVESISQDFSNGPVEQTGNALDLALNGNGFFSVKSTQSGQVAFTRNGHFGLDSAGFIVDGGGARLQMLPVDAAGNPTSTTPIDAQVPQISASGSSYATIAVKSDGSVVAGYADGTTATVGKVAMANFPSPQRLLQIGNEDYLATGLSGSPAYSVPGAGGAGNVLSGSLEQSNVDVAAEMVGLITAQRYFQANAKAIDTATQIADAIINLRT